MPRFTLVVLAGLIVGCSSSARPVNLIRPTTAAVPQTLACVQSQFQRLGYSVVDTGPAGNTITGIRIHTVPRLLRWIGFQDTANQITADISQEQLQVTAVSSDPGNPAEGGPAPGTLANRETERHAEQIIGACT